MSANEHENERIVAWGAGISNVASVRESESDLAYATGTNGAEWIEKCERDDYWCVSLEWDDALFDALDADPAVAGYQVCDCNGV